MPTSMMEMRNSVASAVKDRIHLIATGGTIATFEDQVELTDFDDTMAGAQLLVVSGLNVGQVVRVISNSQSTGTLSVQPNFANPILPGDEADLFRLHNRGFRVREYRDGIRTVVGGRDYKNLREVVSIIYPPFDSGIATTRIPAHLEAVYAVQSQLSPDVVRDIRYSPWTNSNGWHVETATRQLTLSGSEARISHGTNLVILGYEVAPLPDLDTDLITLDEEWVRYSVIAHLCMNKSPVHDRWAIEAMQKAAAREPFVTPSLHSNTVFMRESTS